MRKKVVSCILLGGILLGMMGCTDNVRIIPKPNGNESPSHDTAAVSQTETSTEQVSTEQVIDEKKRVIDRVDSIYCYMEKAYGSNIMNRAKLDSLFCSNSWNEKVEAIYEMDKEVDGIGFFDADYWVMGQDFDKITHKDITVQNLTETEAVVSLSLRIFESSPYRPIVLELKKERGNWYISDFIDKANDVDWEESMIDYLGDNYMK